MRKNKHVALVILAAGKGTRFQHIIPKQFTRILSRPVYIAATLPFLEACKNQLSSIVFVCPYSYVRRTRREVDRYINTSAHVAVISGGEQRIRSVFKAIEYISKHDANADVAVIHDGVRPLIHPKDIRSLMDDFLERRLDASVLSKAMPESLLMIKATGLAVCVNREQFRLAETPDLIKMSVLRQIHQAWSKKIKHGRQTLDIKELISRNKRYTLGAFEGKYVNTKLTYPADMLIIRSYAKRSDTSKR